MRVEGKTTTREDREGEELSLRLFIIVMNETSRQVNEDLKGTYIGYRKLRPVYINELMYRLIC